MSFMSISPPQHEGRTCDGDPAHSTDAVALGGVKRTDFMVYDSEQRVLQGFEEKVPAGCRAEGRQGVTRGILPLKLW